jgi:hypothetical protein
MNKMVDNNPNESVQKRSAGNVDKQVVLEEAIKRIAQVNARIVDCHIVMEGIAGTQVDLVQLNFKVSLKASDKDVSFFFCSNMYIYMP